MLIDNLPLLNENNLAETDFLIISDCLSIRDKKLGKALTGVDGQVMQHILTVHGQSLGNCSIMCLYNQDDTAFRWIKQVSKVRKKLPGYVYHSPGVFLSESFADVLQEYRGKLYDLINSAKARNILVLGEYSLFTLFNEIDIHNYRGSVLTHEDCPGKVFVAAMHPRSFRSGNFQGKEHLVNQYCTLLDAFKFSDPYLEPDKPTLITSPTFGECCAYLKQCREASLIGFDIETIATRTIVTNNPKLPYQDQEISCFSLSCKPYEGICIPLYHGNRIPYFTEEEEAYIWGQLRDILENKNITKIIQNSMFDVVFMGYKYGIYINPVEDTMVAQAILHSDLPKGLGFLVSIYTNSQYYKDDGKQHFKDSVINNTFWEYSAKDAAFLIPILQKQLDLLEKQGNIESYVRRLETLPALQFISIGGIRVDKNMMQDGVVEADRQIEDILQQLEQLAGHPLNPGSPKQVAEYFYTEKKAAPIKNRGKVSTDVDALKKLAGKGFKEAALMLDYRKVKKFVSSYLKMPIDLDGRIRCSINPYGTISGRLSTSRNIFNVGTNLQNEPKDFKKYMLADQDHILYELDYSQGENRCVAVIAPDSNMMRAFNTGMDIHSLTGSYIAGLSYEEVKEQAANGVNCPLGLGNRPWRHWGKMANHALNYGLGPVKFAMYCEIPVADARKIRDIYYSIYPGVGEYHKWVEYFLKQHGFLTNPFGLTKKFLNRRDATVAYSWIPQSTIAEKVNAHGLVPLMQDSIFEPVRLLNQVHDSIVFELPCDLPAQQHVDILLRLREYMEQPVYWKERELVIPVDCKASTKNLKDMKDIDIRTVDGCLQGITGLLKEI